jgi:HD-like signal output (HDOD) protein
MTISSAPTGNKKATLDLLWSRMRQRGNLPGFSKVVSAVTAAMRGEDETDFSMTKTVLSDPALTQRVLALANSAMYAAFGQNINTVSKAIIVLGTDSIGHLALGLKLIDGLSSAASDSAVARAEMEKAVLAGHIARQVASSASTRDIEEAVVCSMLHSLGRMVAVFYLSDRWVQMQARSAGAGIDESEAAQEILGMGLDELGRLTAQHWGLPSALVDSMQNFPPAPVSEPLSHTDWLAAVSTLSTSCADVLCQPDDTADAGLEQIAQGYTEMLGIETEQILTAVVAGKETARAEMAPVKAIAALADDRRKSADSESRQSPSSALLIKGVADMRGVSASASSAQMMAMALETVYKGLGMTRAISFLRSPAHASYMAGLYFGEDLQDIIPRLAFSDAYQPDVFHASLANDKMIFVQDAHTASFVNKLPRWWKDAFPRTHSFIVLPLTVKRQSVGFIYGDWDPERAGQKIEAAEAAALDELRSMVVNAVEQRRKQEPGWMI